MRFDKWQNSLGQPYNAIVQAKSVVLRNTAAMSSTSGFTTITDGTASMSISFTPKFANSLIKIDWTFQGSGAVSDLVGWCAPFRDSNSLYTNTTTGILNGYNVGEAWKTTYGTASDNNVMNTFTGFYYDEAGNTSARTYSLRIKHRGGSYFINRSEQDLPNQNYSTRGISTLSVMEIAQ